MAVLQNVCEQEEGVYMAAFFPAGNTWRLHFSV
jgi:hypothetical protein